MFKELSQRGFQGNLTLPPSVVLIRKNPDGTVPRLYWLLFAVTYIVTSMIHLNLALILFFYGIWAVVGYMCIALGSVLSLKYAAYGIGTVGAAIAFVNWMNYVGAIFYDDTLLSGDLAGMSYSTLFLGVLCFSVIGVVCAKAAWEIHTVLRSEQYLYW